MLEKTLEVNTWSNETWYELGIHCLEMKLGPKGGFCLMVATELAPDKYPKVREALEEFFEETSYDRVWRELKDLHRKLREVEEI